MLRCDNVQKRRKYLYYLEDEPPPKKSDTEKNEIIKSLVHKQLCTKSDINEIVNVCQQFENGPQIVPFSDCATGTTSLQTFQKFSNEFKATENFKQLGLTQDDISMYETYKLGEDELKNKYKNMSSDALKSRIDSILNIVEKVHTPESNTVKNDIQHPMDIIQSIEQDFTNSINYCETKYIKKIRKKARSIGNQIKNLENTKVLGEPKLKCTKNISDHKNDSKWDKKTEANVELKKANNGNKVFTCNNPNYYTIKNGKIVMIAPPNQDQSNVVASLENKSKLSIDEIKQLPKFKNYETGQPSKILYLKNLAKNIAQEDLLAVLCDVKKDVSVKIMTGRMRGQAFIEFPSVEMAQGKIDVINGSIIKNKPVIASFGRNVIC